MSDKNPIKPIRQPIVIDQVHAERGKSGNDLMRCYFLPADVDGFYNFYDEHDRTLATGVRTGTSFPFLLHGHAWTITLGDISHFVASGGWNNNAPAPIGEPGIGAEQDGSFQASSNGGVVPDAITEDAAVAPPAGAVVISGVSGTSDKDKLKDCYFLANGTSWDLYNKNGVLLKSGITSGNGFTFDHDKNNNITISWTVSNFVISTQDSITTASGNWSNTDPHITDAQEGTFQASSSGGVETGEVASGASA